VAAQELFGDHEAEQELDFEMQVEQEDHCHRRPHSECGAFGLDCFCGEISSFLVQGSESVLNPLELFLENLAPRCHENELADESVALRNEA